MKPPSPTASRSTLAAAIGGLAVVEFLFLPLAAWAILALRWARGGGCGRLVPAAIPAGVILVASLAPVETVAERAMTWPTTVPKPAMTVAELREPERHGLDRPRTFPYSIGGPEAMNERVVHFPSLRPTLGEFIAAIEAETGLRHRFASCGNGWTILWGVDNIMHLGFAPEP